MNFTFNRSKRIAAFVFATFASTQGAWSQEHSHSSGTIQPQPKGAVPKGVLIVKGAWSSSSDSTTPIPERASLEQGVYVNPYFGITYEVPAGWEQKYTGPPPSDSGRYVLAQFTPTVAIQEKAAGNMLIAAHDLFFSPQNAENALALVKFQERVLAADYQIERPPTEVTIAGRSFVRFNYASQIAGLHWNVLSTGIRGHLVQFIITTRDQQVAETIIQQMNSMTLPAEASAAIGRGGGENPLCIDDYANSKNVIEKADVFFSSRRWNPIPVRVIVDKEGKVKHIHFISAFTDQEKSITDALAGWKFSPYLQNGKPVEVETGIMFGRVPGGGVKTSSTK